MNRTIYIFAALCVLLFGCSGGYTTIKAREGATPAGAESQENGLSNELHEGLILYRQGDYAQARDFFDNAKGLDPENWLAYYYLGLVSTKLRDHDDAQTQFRHCLKRAPAARRSRSRIYIAIAENWELRGDTGRARLNYGTALDLYPESIDAKQGLARLAGISQIEK